MNVLRRLKQSGTPSVQQHIPEQRTSFSAARSMKELECKLPDTHTHTPASGRSQFRIKGYSVPERREI